MYADPRGCRLRGAPEEGADDGGRNVRRLLELAGLVAGATLVAFGVAVIVLGATGYSTVRASLEREHIVGSADMSPALIRAEVEEAGLANVELPDCSVARQRIEDGASARCFADYMRVHALLRTGGLTYAEMPRYATADGRGTDEAAQALLTESGTPVANPQRELWVTETALATALNVSYIAERLALFGIVIGVALVLSGVGFVVLDRAALRRRPGAPA
jgi:hypothetical protein